MDVHMDFWGPFSNQSEYLSGAITVDKGIEKVICSVQKRCFDSER